MDLLLKFLLYAGLTSMVLMPLILLYIHHKTQEKLEWISETLDLLLFLKEKD